MSQNDTAPLTPFTPTTERVRDRFIAHSEITGSSIGGPAEFGAAFDRWFAAAVVAATPVIIVTTVSTEAEYAALPIGSVVRGNNQYAQIAERIGEEEDADLLGYRWVYPGSSKGAFQHETIARNVGAATVLFMPPAAGPDLPEDTSTNEETSTSS
jgi:hypothetical protein